MTDLEKKADKYLSLTQGDTDGGHAFTGEQIKNAFKNGYMQGKVDESNKFNESLRCYGDKIMSLEKELKEIKSFLCQLMLCTDAYDFWADECEEITKKYYGGNLAKWEEEND